jgi:lipoic acid synthetase
MTEKPEWLKVRVPTPTESAGMADVRQVLARFRLTTVCQGAVCPNAVECWSARTATFMVLGDLCTRGCRFCGVETRDVGRPVESDEPDRLADAVVELGLRHVVLTSVDRDDLQDGGSKHFAACVRALKTTGASVEVLIPDFGADPLRLAHILSSGADVLGHNVETVQRLTPAFRDRRASYRQSLDVLAYLRSGADGRVVKSGLMVGLGERREETRQTLQDLFDAGVRAVTVGQYLRPSFRAAPVARFVSPEEFEEIGAEARAIGFDSVVVGPFVRSSYHAARAFLESCA